MQPLQEQARALDRLSALTRFLQKRHERVTACGDVALFPLDAVQLPVQVTLVYAPLGGQGHRLVALNLPRVEFLLDVLQLRAQRLGRRRLSLRADRQFHERLLWVTRETLDVGPYLLLDALSIQGSGQAVTRGRAAGARKACPARAHAPRAADVVAMPRERVTVIVVAACPVHGVERATERTAHQPV